MKVALLYDRLNKVGGAEQVLQAFHALFPEADWYTSVWNPRLAPFSRAWRVHPSFLNFLPVLRNHHELIPFLMPFAFESFDLSSYDLVISIGSAESKGVITRADCAHFHYCLTPTRYLWSHRELYLSRPQFGVFQRLAAPLVNKIFQELAKWDLVAATRTDTMISISKHVKQRVQKYYNRDSVVIYPPVNTAKFALTGHRPSTINHRPSDYYLTVSRLVPYKNLELLVKVFRGTPRRLVVLGTGSELRRLRRLAGKQVEFRGFVAERELIQYYQGCRAFLQANTEDFGIGMVEAQAAGRPVIAFKEGGAGEIVRDGVTGILVSRLTVRGFRQALDRFERMKLSSQSCRENAARFDTNNWQQQMKAVLEPYL